MTNANQFQTDTRNKTVPKAQTSLKFKPDFSGEAERLKDLSDFLICSSIESTLIQGTRPYLICGKCYIYSTPKGFEGKERNGRLAFDKADRWIVAVNLKLAKSFGQ